MMMMMMMMIIIISGSTVIAKRWPPHIGDSVILLRHLVGLLWTSDQPVAKSLYQHRTTQHRNSNTNFHVSSGIRTHDPNNQAAKAYALDSAATWIGANKLIADEILGVVAAIQHMSLSS
jgi:hypothetical protein